MPWNDNSDPGPWNPPSGGDQDRPDPKKGGGRSGADTPKTGGEGGDPWGDAPRLRERPPETSRVKSPKTNSPPPRGPDLDDLSRLLKARLGWALDRGKAQKLNPRIVGTAIAAGVAIWALTGLYEVQPGEQAAVMRFGAYVGQTGPGLNYHLPYPIETVRTVSVSAVNRLDVGGSGGEETPSENQLLTRDGNIVDVGYAVQWRVADVPRYLFRIADPDAAVKMAAESAMREAVGQTPLQDILGGGRSQVQARAATLMQAMLDRDGAGVSIVGVQVRDAQPPLPSAPAFRDVVAARQDAEAATSEAEVYRNRVVGDAKAEAARAIQAAQGYRDQVEAEARGEADRFALIDAQYRRAPAVTRQRIYIETMEHVLRASNKVVVDGREHSTVALPPELFKRHPTPDASQGPVARPAGPAPQGQGQGQGVSPSQGAGQPPRTDGAA